jgi:hypothetical protein
MYYLPGLKEISVKRRRADRSESRVRQVENADVIGVVFPVAAASSSSPPGRAMPSSRRSAGPRRARGGWTLTRDPMQPRLSVAVTVSASLASVLALAVACMAPPSSPSPTATETVGLSR